MYNVRMLKPLTVTACSIVLLLSLGTACRGEEQDRASSSPDKNNQLLDTVIIPAEFGIIRGRSEGPGPVSFILIRREGIENGRINYAKTVRGITARPPLAAATAAVILVRPDEEERRDLAENGRLAVKTIAADPDPAERALLAQKIERYALVIKRMKEIVETVERESLPKELRALIAKSEDFRNNLLSLEDYTRFLTRLGKKTGVSLATYKQIALFASSLRLQKEIEPAKAAQEKEQLLERMKPLLDSRDRRKLKESETAFKNGELSRNAYFQLLKSLAQKTGISFRQYRYLADYCSYIRADADLDRGALRDECREARSKIEQALLAQQSRPQEKRVAMLNDFHILFNLLSLTASRKECAYFEENRAAFAPERLRAFLMDQEEKLLDKPALGEGAVLAITMMDHSLEQIKGLCALLPKIESFLNASFAREDAALEEMTAGLLKEGIAVGIVILDDPSLETLRSALKKGGFPYLVISPAAGEPKREDLFPQTMIKKGR